MEDLSHSKGGGFMKFNTETLGYKLLSGKLKESRKHSEQLNKYVAGYLDADGCISLTFSKYKDYFTLGLTFNFTQSFSNDPDGSLLKAIRDFYNLGTISHRNLEGYSSISIWNMSTKDILKLYGLLSKHLRIKGTHWDNLIWLYNELKLFHLTSDNIEELKTFCKCSRQNSKWLKRPKHLSMAWVAGYFDGDGHYRIRRRKKYIKSYKKECSTNELCVQVSCDKNDYHIVEKLKEDFKGALNLHKDGHYIWKRSLGKTSHTFAINFLKHLRKYCCLEKKYIVIEAMIEFHNDHQQRLNKSKSKD